MSRTSYFSLAFLLATIAFGIYEWQNERDFFLSKFGKDLMEKYRSVYQNGGQSEQEGRIVVNSDSKMFKTNWSGEGSERELNVSSTEQRMGASEEGKVSKTGESEVIKKDGETLKNNGKSPPGHMKKLGEHGSQIIEGEIEELDYVPSGKDFYEHFLRKRRPLVLRGAIRDWPAVEHWSNESYLNEKYGSTIFDVQFSKNYEGEFPVKKTMNLSEYLNVYKVEDVYLDCPFPHSEMINDIMVPYCMQCDEIINTIGSTHLLFSSGNTSSSCHIDGYENLLSLIAGTKEILVADPKYVQSFYPRNHTTVNIESPIDPEAVDLEKFPRLAEVPFHRVRRT